VLPPPPKKSQKRIDTGGKWDEQSSQNASSRKKQLRDDIADQRAEQSLYIKHQKIYPRQVHGTFAQLRVLGILALMSIYYCTPLIRWNDHQAILFDLPERKFHIFGLTLWPQDFIYLAALLIIAGLTLFLVTAVAGRIWCGYSCPQTVWTEVFLWMERKVEGNHTKQMKRDSGPMTLEKFRIKATKHFFWITFSMWTGFTFVGYFTPIDELAIRLSRLELSSWESAWILLFGFATYGNAGWMREQVCIYMCPYARFQSAMFDADTLIIAYDEKRGERRGRRKRSVDRSKTGLGDCIDCTLCVQACPTGIDIRKGLQYECIACSACIDACDDVMDKMSYKRGLISYTTENALSGKIHHVVRPRIIIYSLIMAFITLMLFYSISQRMELDIDIIRDRNTLFRETSEGLIENVYTVRILNMHKDAHVYTLAAGGVDGLRLKFDAEKLFVAKSSVADYIVRLQVDEANLEKQSNEVTFYIIANDNDKLIAEKHARFLGPRK
jgi:cytochrome c oxidase accessory protein FixG